MTTTDDSLALFHPLIAAWFRERVGAPTDAQAMAWPRIAAGEHVLVTAPTGSGKTLTAFLWALNQLITGEYQDGQCSVLYISPLKALNNDIRRNLLTPLARAGSPLRGTRANPFRASARKHAAAIPRRKSAAACSAIRRRFLSPPRRA